MAKSKDEGYEISMKIPEGAEKIIQILTDAGYEAYVVGGCVRDKILGVEPEDWDITTSAKPNEIKKLFRKTIDTGIEHGTVTVLLSGGIFEVTTYRMDAGYEDHRHPDKVIFTPSLEEDLKRRDFTINAMAYNHTRGIVDLYDGRRDLKEGVIRAVGEPDERFREDALRMLRAIRFSAKFGFDIEERTFDAIKKNASTITYTSAERIQTELVKLLCSDHPARIRAAYETGLSRYFLPELDLMMETEQNNPHHIYSVGEHTLCVLKEVNNIYKKLEKEKDISEDDAHRKKKALMLSALFHDVGKPECKTTDEAGTDHFYKHDKVGADMAVKICRRLKLDNFTTHMVKLLVMYHDSRYGFAVDDAGEYTRRSKNKMRRLMGEVGVDNMPYLFILQEADILAQSDYHKEDKLHTLRAGITCYKEIKRDNDAIHIQDLAISGLDLIEKKGYTTGPAIGAELKRLLDLVIDNPSLNTYDTLMDLCKEK